VTANELSVRRATVEDLAVLRGLWQSERLPGYELEKRLTEFHVVVRPDGLVIGAVGFQVAGAHALVHSLAFTSPALAAEGLPRLWEHLRALAQTQGVARLWAQGPAAAWPKAGFAAATPAQLKKRPAVFGPARGAWHTLALRDEAAVSQAWEKEFAALQEAHQEQAERLRRQAAFWKLLAWSMAALFFFGAAWLLAVLLRSAPRTPRR